MVNIIANINTNVQVCIGEIKECWSTPPTWECWWIATRSNRVGMSE